jgi:hypothetical protein
MKKFFSIEKFKELKVLFILESIMTLLVIMLVNVNELDLTYFDWMPFTLSIIIWSLCSLIDKNKYFNLATLIATGIFMYSIFWFMLITL